MYYVYIIRSDTVGKHYIGYTSDLGRRLKNHNSGYSESSTNMVTDALVFDELEDETENDFELHAFIIPFFISALTVAETHVDFIFENKFQQIIANDIYKVICVFRI